MSKKELVEQIEDGLVDEDERELEFVNSGSTLLNLALSDRAGGGFAKGSLVNVVGDSSSGKTFAALTCLAMCVYDSDFDDYLLIHDDVENRQSFKMGKLFGQDAADRIESPGGLDAEDGMPINSETVEDFQDYVGFLLEDGQPFVYVLDSLDALTTVEDNEQYEGEREARKKGKDVSGSYGLAKPKAMSEMLRRIKFDLKKTNSLLIIISQTRTNIGFGFAKKRRAGGDALTFYCQHVAWLAVAETIKTKDRKVGVKSRWKVTKNSITGKEREVDIPILYYYGLDNIASMIDFLVTEKYWSKKKRSIVAEDFEITATEEKLIRHIEENELEEELGEICQHVWTEIESALVPERKGRFQ